MSPLPFPVSILGCGWFGMPLGADLVRLGFPVKGSTTSSDKLPALEEAGIQPFLARFEAGDESYLPGFFASHLLIICLPPGRSSDPRHYLAKIERIAAAAARSSVKEVIFISSTSVYGDQNRALDEQDKPFPDTPSGEAVLQAEKFLTGCPFFGTTVIRFGGLFGPGRDPGRFFAGKTAIANGRAPVNLIHLEDGLGLTRSVILKGAFGYVFNACSPQHPSRAEFYTAASHTAALELPVFKDELLNWKVITCKNAGLHLNYKFSFSLHPLGGQ